MSDTTITDAAGGIPEVIPGTEPAPADGPWTLYKPARRWLLLAVLFLALLCSMTDRYLMSILLEPIKAEFHASDTVMGLLTGFAFAAFYAILGLPIARWADRGDRRVIISLSLAVWSVMSALCGFARNLPMLALARVGVGVGEAGATPPVFSLVPDYFPPNQRGRATSMLVLAMTVGILIAYTGGAQINKYEGWRAAFLWLSVPGIPFALLSFFVLSEPRRVLGHAASESKERVGRTIGVLLRKRSLVLGVLSLTIYNLVVTGAFLWIPAYLQRVLKVDLATQGALYGSVSVLIPLFGTIIGGLMADRLTKRSPKWLAWLPAIGIGLSMPFYELSFFTHSYTLFLILSVVAIIPLSAAAPTAITLVLSVSGPSRRSLSMAVNGLITSLVGVGGGAYLAGALSDYLAPTYGVDSLRYALMIITALLALCTLFYLAAARFVQRELEN
ncbi:MAG TPA: MFS transporter [Caulobacteraceae bacterium]|jgi:predicted MFS family arabinose efflux permease